MPREIAASPSLPRLRIVGGSEVVGFDVATAAAAFNSVTIGGVQTTDQNEQSRLNRA